MEIRFWVMLIAITLGVSGAAQAVPFPAGDEYVYRVKPGDTLIQLSDELLDPAVSWDKVARYNRLKNPNLISPGMDIRIRMAWLRSQAAQAHIEAVSGEVRLNGRVAQLGDVVAVGNVVETAAGGNARMSLPDGSSMNVLERSNVAVQQLDKKQQGNFFSTMLRLVTGRIEVFKKKYPEAQSPMRVQSKNATIGVRGTHFRMGQEGENSLAEIEDGAVNFTSQPKGWVTAEDEKWPLALVGGNGSVADGVHPPQVIPLLPRPVFPAAQNDAGAVSFDMPALPGAKGYRGEIAEDENFQRIIRAVNAEGSRVAINGLSPGSYWLRLRAVDEHGLQGMEGKVAFVAASSPASVKPTVVLSDVVLTPPEIVIGDQIAMRWQGTAQQQYELQIAGSADFNLPWITMKAHGTQLNVPSPVAGRYFVRVRAVDGQRAGIWSNVVEMQVP
jgi:hypothetical protein